MLSLETLTLDQIPALTDEDFDRLYAEIAGTPPITLIAAMQELDRRGFRLGIPAVQMIEMMESDGVFTARFGLYVPNEDPTIPGRQLVYTLEAAQGEDAHFTSPIAPELRSLIDDVSKPPRVCKPDCPASVLQALPGLVEVFTGIEVEMVIYRKCDGWRARIVTVFARVGLTHDKENRVLIDFAESNPGRHLVHAYHVAAVAACIVLGKKREG